VILYDTLRFRRQIPILHARENLGWSHYRALLQLPADKLAHYEQLADEQAWTTRQLKRAIESDADVVPLDDGLDLPRSPLRPRFGEPFTYRVIKDALHPTGPPAIDFGFHHVWVPDAGLAGFEPASTGDIVTLDPTALTARVRDGRRQLWTYVARVQRLLDGDTFDVVVDLGLGHRAFPRLRLRGVDTAELYTQAGRQALQFVEGVLASVDFVIVATRRTDSYGRYLADVKYLAGATDPKQVLAKGTYLNRQLLNEGLARRYLG